MKHTFIAIQLLFLLNTYSVVNAQWESIWPVPEHGANFLAFKKDLSLGYLYELENTKPILYQTHDSGKTWKQKRLFFTNWSNEFVGMKIKTDGTLLMITNTKICILDTGTLLMDTIYDIKANNATQIDEGLRLTRMLFVSEDTGFIVSGNVFRTTDGGENWTRISDIFSEVSSGLHFIDSKTGFFMGFTENSTYKLYSTIDGGFTWDTTGPNLLTKIIYSFRFISADTGFYGDANGCIYKTTDKGKSWEKWFCLNDGKTGSNVTSINFLNSNIGWVTVKNHFQPFKTVDGGKTFFSQPLPNPKSSYLKSVEIITPGLMFITGPILYRTTNQGGSPLLSVKDIDESPIQHGGITIYPNPTNSRFAIDTKQEGVVFSAEIYDIAGRLVLVLNNVLNNQQIDVSSLIAGTYIVRVLSRDKTSNSILIKE